MLCSDGNSCGIPVDGRNCIVHKTPIIVTNIQTPKVILERNDVNET